MKAIIVYRNGSTFDCGVVENAKVLNGQAEKKRCFSYLKLDSKTSLGFASRLAAADCVMQKGAVHVPAVVKDVKGWPADSKLLEYAVKMESKQPENGIDSVILLFEDDEGQKLQEAFLSAVGVHGWHVEAQRMSARDKDRYVVALVISRNMEFI